MSYRDNEKFQVVSLVSTDIDPKYIQNSLLRWFQNHGRPLPWREAYDPYHVWLSEIMLQQTQMERGVGYFQKWIARFPTIFSIAQASIDEILKYWEGLGYYARGRNLHLAAKKMVEEYNGEVPTEYNELLGLPGVGPYTAAAISSIAFNADIPVIDANVERVFARLFDIDKPLKSKGVQLQVKELASFLLPEGRARHFNQALMDLGGVICTPKNPDCGNCPVSAVCKAYQGNYVNDRPIRKKKQPLIPIEMSTAILVHNGHIYIQQRRDDDIWGGLWEFPGGSVKEGEKPNDAAVREYQEETGFNIEICKDLGKITHYYTKYRVTLHCFLCCLKQESILPTLAAAQNYHWISADRLQAYGFPAGHRKLIDLMQREYPGLLLRGCSVV